MIFVTVGTQLPFERLIAAVDGWVGHHPGLEVVMQLGETCYRPKHCRFQAYTTPQEWAQWFKQANLVVSHAGMGTILKSLDVGKPMIIMPRLAALNEHRNDHQLATAARFNQFSNIRVVNDDVELKQALDNPPLAGEARRQDDSGELLRLRREIRQFVEGALAG